MKPRSAIKGGPGRRTGALTFLASVALGLAAGGVGAQEDEFAIAAEVKPRDEARIRELTTHQNKVEVGVGFVSEDSFKFGEYNGLEEEGPFFIGNADIQKHNAYNSDDAHYWIFSGSNLGLTSRYLNLEYGDQGNYALKMGYDELEKNQTDSFRTIFNGAGTTNLTLPAGWVPIRATNTANTAADLAERHALIDPFLKDYDIDHDRKNYRFGVSKTLGTAFDVKLNYRHESKDGDKITGSVIGNSGGNPRYVLIPEPIDYLTNEVDATIAYATDRLQLQLGYYMSLFDNENTGFTWQNPYAAIAGWDADAGFPTGIGQMGMPPDNEFHQVLFSGGYNFAYNTRLTANVARGWMTQDDDFLPYTVNPGLRVTTLLPRASLDGEIDTTLVNITLTSRPWRRVGLKASYRFDDRDNDTPQAQFLYIGADSQDQLGVATERARTNLPLSRESNLVKAEADIEVFHLTKLILGYDYEEIDRTFEEVEETQEDTYHVALRRTLNELLSGGILFAHSSRDGSTYVDNRPYLRSYSPEFTGPQAAAGTQFDNHPLLRKFYMADRDRDRVRVDLTYSPLEILSLQLNAEFRDDEFDESILGLTESTSQAYTADLSLMPTENLSAYAFYTYEKYESEQADRQFTGTTKAAQATLITSPFDYVVTNDDRIDTVGLGLTWNPIRDKLDINGEFTYSESTGEIDVATGAAIVPAGTPLPDLNTQIYRIDANATYNVDEKISVRFAYIFEKLINYDWAYDFIDPATPPLGIAGGNDAPEYTDHVIGVSVIYRFF